MCFSASASFISSAVLITIGSVTMAKTKAAPQRLLAAMPLLFAFQQLAEGLVWMSVIDPAYAHLQRTAMYAFLLFAQVVWPLFVPFAVLLVEKDPVRKKKLSWFALSGCLAAIFFIYCLSSFDAHIGVNPYHIKYELDFPFVNRWFYGIIYFIPAMLPTFISSFRRMRILGSLLLVSYLISRFAYRDYIVSVWCFFGALSSISVLYIIKEITANTNSIIRRNKEVYTS
jgi:lipid-A-disaccharide synthase-like uncharacterized protein